MRKVVFFGLLLALLVGVPGQQPPKRTITEVQTMLGEIDVANRILPLVLTKEQIRKILPVIERCRQNVRNQEQKEARELLAMAEEIEKVHAGVIKGVVPSPEFLAKMNDVFKRFENERNAVKMANGILLGQTLNEVLHDGQKRAIVNVVDKVFNEQNRKWEEASEDAKIQFFALGILMSEDGYNFLVKLNRSLP